MKSTSLTTRIIVPFVFAAAIAALIVGWGSWAMGHHAAMRGMSQRADAIKQALKPSTFPLTPSTLDLLSRLTRTDWIVVGEDNRLLSTTLKSSTVDQWKSDIIAAISLVRDTSEIERIRMGQQEFYAFSFSRQLVAADAASGEAGYLIVLFDQSEIDSVARRAAVLPLITGLSTIALASGLVMFVATRLIRRLQELESGVQRIAKGDFDTQLVDNGQDEIDRLSGAVNRMTDQLKTLWRQIERDQGAQLLHQISGGMAHQLRNTLTGAKMAMQLHVESYRGATGDEIQVAMRQLDIAEDYINRLLTLGKRDQRPDQPIQLRRCFDDLRTTHDPIARHLGVDLHWGYDRLNDLHWVKDGSSLTAAVSNLILNALQAGQRVQVDASLIDRDCVVLVKDDGPGVDHAISEELFEPFVSSKPEGLGLGLALVKRLAEYLGGDIQWFRENNTTTFQLRVSTVSTPEIADGKS